MVALVERMLDLHKQLSAATLPYDRERLRRQIEATDREIDDLVYELYDLTDEEIKLVELNRIRGEVVIPGAIICILL